MTTNEHSDFQVELAHGGAVSRRIAELLPDGSYLFEDDLQVEGELTATIITCTAWLLELYDVSSGTVVFANGHGEVSPTARRFGVFYPPFSITKPTFRDVKTHVIGVAGNVPVPSPFISGPILFEAKFRQPPSGSAQVITTLESARRIQRIDINQNPSLLSIKAKRLIDETYLTYPSISRIAGRLGVRHEHLSRQFRSDFGMSPSNYLRQLRIADAPLRLAKGEEIISVSQEVGYNDLSRFYKQFRKTTDTSPGACKAILRPKKIRI